MMSAHVGILCSEEMFNWRDCLMKSISENLDNRIKFSTCTEHDYIDKTKENIFKTEWSDALVLVLMISPNLLDRLEKSSNIIFPALKAKVYLFFCGVEKNCSKNLVFKNRIGNSNSLSKYNHEEFHSLVESVIEMLFQSDLNNPVFADKQATLHQSSKKFERKDFLLIPKNLLIEKQAMVMVVIFDEDLDADDFNITVDGVCDKKSIKPDRIAPNVLKFSVPNGISPGLGRVSVYADGRRVGSQSFLSHSLHNQSINILDSIINKVKQTRQLSLDELDEIISKSVIADATQKSEVSSEKFDKQRPRNVLDLATKHNLKESCAVISKFDRNKLQRKTFAGETSRNILTKSPSDTTLKSTSTKNCAIPEHQKELIEILNAVKFGQSSMEDAEKLFKYWNLRHEGCMKDDKRSLKKNLMLDTRKISDPILPEIQEMITSQSSNEKRAVKTSSTDKVSEKNDSREIRVRLSTPNDYSSMNSSTTANTSSPTDNYITPEIYEVSTNDLSTYENDSSMNSSMEIPESQIGIYLSMTKVSRENSPAPLTNDSKQNKSAKKSVAISESDSLPNYVNIPSAPQNTLRTSIRKVPPPRPSRPSCKYNGN